MQSVGLILACVLHAEEIPLGSAMRAVVIFEVQFVFEGAHAHRLAQVSGLKARFEDESLIDGQRTRSIGWGALC